MLFILPTFADVGHFGPAHLPVSLVALCVDVAFPCPGSGYASIEADGGKA